MACNPNAYDTALNRIGLSLCRDAAELERYKRILQLAPEDTTRIDWLSRTLVDGVYYVEFASQVPDTYRVCESPDNLNWTVIKPALAATGTITTWASPANPEDSPPKYFSVYVNGIPVLPCPGEAEPSIPGILDGEFDLESYIPPVPVVPPDLYYLMYDGTYIRTPDGVFRYRTPNFVPPVLYYLTYNGTYIRNPDGVSRYRTPNY